jgi:hypothetical protein
MTGDTWQLYAGDHLAAHLHVTEADMPWLRAEVEALAPLDGVRGLFERELTLVDAGTDDDMADWDEAYYAIRKATTLRYPDGRIVPEYILHLDQDGAHWRWHDEPFTENFPPVDTSGLVSLPPFFSLPDEPAETPPPGPRPGSAIGHDCGTWLVASSGGQIWSVDTAKRHPLRFVSRTVDGHRAMLDVLARRNDYVRTHPYEPENIAELQADLASIDAFAPVEPEGWWTVVLEQIGDGLL